MIFIEDNNFNENILHNDAISFILKRIIYAEIMQILIFKDVTYAYKFL